MVYEIPNSHFWDDLEMMINYFTQTPQLDRQYILTGLRNMQTHGYCIVKSKPHRSIGRFDKLKLAEKRKVNERILV